jgi:xylulose-5-phosphate/fructose-6-phosphate phosphoketolase
VTSSPRRITPTKAAYAEQELLDKLIEHGEYIREYGEEMPAIREWRWEK